MVFRACVLLGGLVLLALPLFAAQPVYDAAVFYPVGDAPTGIVCFDFNNDGFLDLATADSASNAVSILINNGAGAFLEAVTYTAGEAPIDIAAGDLNSDNYADLVVADRFADMLSVLWNAGDGTFTSQTEIPVHSGVCAVAVTQLTDGGSDIIVSQDLSRVVSIVRSNGDGTFQAPVDHPVRWTPSGICTADFNLDGYTDFAVGSYEYATYIFRNDGAGSFPDVEENRLGSGATDLAAGDFNGNEYADLVLARVTEGMPVVCMLNTDGLFQFSSSGPWIPNKPNSVVAADLNADGYDDLAFADVEVGAVRILVNLRKEHFSFRTLTASFTGDKPRAIAYGDFDLDGDLDLAVANSGSNDVAVLTNYFCGDLNGDHTVDLGDITEMIEFVYLGGKLSVIRQAANTDSSTDGEITLADITGLISHVYLGGGEPMCSQ